MEYQDYYDIKELKEKLMKKGNLLSISNSDDLLAVSCFIRDLLQDFRIVYTDIENPDPYAEITEDQYTDTHQMYRRILKRIPYLYGEKEFDLIERHLRVLVNVFLEMSDIKAGVYAKREF